MPLNINPGTAVELRIAHCRCAFAGVWRGSVMPSVTEPVIDLHSPSFTEPQRHDV